MAVLLEIRTQGLESIGASCNHQDLFEALGHLADLATQFQHHLGVSLDIVVILEHPHELIHLPRGCSLLDRPHDTLLHE